MIDRPAIEVDIACVGFGPAVGGFLTTLSRRLGDPALPPVESRAAQGLPLQVVCYERADDIGFGVSGVVTKARGIRRSFPDLRAEDVPMAADVKKEKVLYLLDPAGASRRTAAMRIADGAIRALKRVLPFERDALELPYTPEFLRKKGGLVLSLGQFNQWVGQQLMMSGAVQIWPGSPAAEPLIEDNRVAGIRLMDQGVDRGGAPTASYLPGMDVRAQLTVVGDGPVGQIGRKIDERFGLPEGHSRHEWAVGMKMVIELPDGVELEPGTVFHTLGYPEPEIFGFLYAHPERVVSVGIFVPSWFDSPVRTAYRYLQHYIQHPYLWRYLNGGRLRSWGAKSIQESGRRGEPRLAGNGYCRIGEGSGSTNVLTGSGVDEAWTTGALLAEGVLDLLDRGRPFTEENLDAAYGERRRASWVESEGRVAEKARDGFQRGFLTGLAGMALAGLSGGRLAAPGKPLPPGERVHTAEAFFRRRLGIEEIANIREECAKRGKPLHDELMDRCGWPPIEYDGRLLVSHQDALLVGGKVQAPAGVADHVVFIYPELCESCGTRICVEMCSGEAIHPDADGPPVFDREKCVHCGACLWNCSEENIRFEAGAGGLHSAEN
ncbi:MAG: 4Fe-4S ferredoxin [Bryobacteraceae bacterium]|nr:4Fe-4S ferredoxin [Bryobacteraceae bacterium]